MPGLKFKVEEASAMSGKVGFDQAPAGDKVGIVRRQSPDRMQSIRQQHPVAIIAKRQSAKKTAPEKIDNPLSGGGGSNHGGLLRESALRIDPGTAVEALGQRITQAREARGL